MLVNSSSSNQNINIRWPVNLINQTAYTSSENNYWSNSIPVIQNNESNVSLGRYSVMTIVTDLATNDQNDLAFENDLKVWINSNENFGLMLQSQNLQVCDISLVNLEGKLLFETKDYLLNSGINFVQTNLQMESGKIILAVVKNKSKKSVYKLIAL